MLDADSEDGWVSVNWERDPGNQKKHLYHYHNLELKWAFLQSQQVWGIRNKQIFSEVILTKLQKRKPPTHLSRT